MSEAHAQPAGWIEVLGWVSLALAFCSAAVVLVDIFVRGYRQRMWIMEVVYPVTALYWGPVALWFYLRHGRRNTRAVIAAEGEPDPEAQPAWRSASLAVSHCGAGCTIGDIVGEWAVLAAGVTIAGKSLWVDMPVDLVLAWLLGIVFQYYTIAPMRGLGVVEGIRAAIKADTLSILAFQVGLFAGMAFYQLVLWSPPLAKTTATYWLMMQLSMIVGFFTAMPVNAWLVRRGLKEKM